MQGDRHQGQNARLFEAMLQIITDPILIFDEDWQLLVVNPTGRHIFPESVVGASATLILKDEAFVAALHKGTLPNEWHVSEEGPFFIPRLLVSPADETLTSHYVLLLRDISSYKKLSHNQNEFVRIVSHDLRTPLTTIKGYTSMIGMVGEINPKQQEYNEKVMSGIAQLASLVENIQDAGRFDVETGFYVMQRSQCDVTEIITRVVDGYLIPAEKQELRLTVKIAQDVPIINADGNMLERALTNLVDNAIKYTPNGGKITVSVERVKEQLIISVTDTGLGISPEDQKRLFQRHVRINREEHKRIKGSGLGLFIVRSVAQRHGGDAWVDSIQNVGSVFAFSIPLAGENLILPDQKA